MKNEGLIINFDKRGEERNKMKVKKKTHA